MIDRFLSRITFDPQVIQQRLRARLSVLEILSLLINLGWVLAIGLTISSRLTFDIENYIKAGQGDFSFYYYAYWIVPFLSLLAHLSYSQIFIFWGVLTVACVFFATRILGGNVPLALLSYQMFYLVGFGQMTGLVVFGMALLWWGLANKRWNVAGLGFLIATTKFQSGAFPALIILLLANISWKDRLRVLVVPAVVHLASLVIYPMWPLHTWQILHSNPPDDQGSLTLWRWIGPAALILWAPACLLPMPKNHRLIVLLTTLMLALPYFQQADMIMLFAFPLGWLPLLGNFGHLRAVFGFEALQALWFIPALIYLMIIVPAGVSFFKNRFRPVQVAGE